MTSKHLTRHKAPWFWRILRKEYHWTVKPKPGPHPLERCIPLGIILRDYLKYAKTMREARIILGEGKIKVDGKVRRDYKYPVGLMDVIEIIPSREFFRVLPHPVKFLDLIPISEEEAKFKLCRIENKTTVKGGNIQLNLHDGRNCLIKVANPMNPEEDVFKTYDTIKVSIPRQELLGHYKFEEGAYAIVIGGNNVGRVGKIKGGTQVFKKSKAIVTLETEKGEELRTIMEYVFIIGKDKPEIKIFEVM
ncbi:MAG: 30S ribosomal protein S4e [Thermoprotei archaeon]|nr:MAG: 30S ribosomal protein S4e [Thermoprotei archaeon]RLF01090.1 MAG: 30S ribosomal protein S4e [Thermoprotei archaeon]